MGKKSDLSPRKKGQIRALMENTELSQREIARRLNVSQKSVSSIKRRLEFLGTAVANLVSFVCKNDFECNNLHNTVNILKKISSHLDSKMADPNLGLSRFFRSQTKN